MRRSVAAAITFAVLSAGVAPRLMAGGDLYRMEILDVRLLGGYEAMVIARPTEHARQRENLPAGCGEISLHLSFPGHWTDKLLVRGEAEAYLILIDSLREASRTHSERELILLGLNWGQSGSQPCTLRFNGFLTQRRPVRAEDVMLTFLNRVPLGGFDWGVSLLAATILVILGRRLRRPRP